MSAVGSIPGLYVTPVPRARDPSPLRSDVAGFVGHTRRGLVGVPVRVEGWRHFLREFGGLVPNAQMPFALRGYFDNGGEVAHVVRLAGPSAKPAAARWTLGELDPGTNEWCPGSPVTRGFRAAAYCIQASSPGTWPNGDRYRLRVSIRYRSEGRLNRPEIDIVVFADDEPTEYLVGLDPNDSDRTLEEQVASSSILIRLSPLGPEPVCPPEGLSLGPRFMFWDNISLKDGSDGETPTQMEYRGAIENLGDQPEVALVVLPEVHQDFISDEERFSLLTDAIQQAESLHDRLVLVDLPDDRQEAESAVQWVAELRERMDPAIHRSAAVYHPRLQVADPFGGIADPLRAIPPSGHVAGLISLLDRQRGAHQTPANASLAEVVDVLQAFTEAEESGFLTAGINPVRCFPGRGILVWGGRTLSAEASGRFVAHRRLIHRLVRAIRRVAEPLVFDTNGPELWLMLTRAITTVLLAAFRSGALKGSQPGEAFRVRCDESTISPSDREEGRVVCEIDVAPAAPMELIRIRIALAAEGKVEVFES